MAAVARRGAVWPAPPPAGGDLRTIACREGTRSRLCALPVRTANRPQAGVAAAPLHRVGSPRAAGESPVAMRHVSRCALIRHAASEAESCPARCGCCEAGGFPCSGGCAAAAAPCDVLFVPGQTQRMQGAVLRPCLAACSGLTQSLPTSRSPCPSALAADGLGMATSPAGAGRACRSMSDTERWDGCSGSDGCEGCWRRGQAWGARLPAAAARFPGAGCSRGCCIWSVRCLARAAASNGRAKW